MKKYLVILNQGTNNFRFIMEAESENQAVAYATATFMIQLLVHGDVPAETDLTKPGGRDALAHTKLNVGAVGVIG